MNGAIKTLEVQDAVQSGGQAVVAGTAERKAQERELLKQMRVKIVKLDPASLVSIPPRGKLRVK